jgi:hypothetical protein
MLACCWPLFTNLVLVSSCHVGVGVSESVGLGDFVVAVVVYCLFFLLLGSF